MTRFQLRNRCFVVTLGFLLFCSGCIIAPIPLVETDTQIVWSGLDAKGKKLSIERQEKTWYLPVLVSPEGPARTRSDKSRYDYFLVDRDSGERTELPFLRLEGVEFGGWMPFENIQGTSCLLATRVGEREPKSKEAAADDITPFEIVVFEGLKLKHRRKIEAMAWPGGNESSTWSRFRQSPDKREAIYQALDGKRRYRVLEDVDEPTETGERPK